MSDLKPFDFSMFTDRQLLDLAFQVRVEIAARRARARSLAHERRGLTELAGARYRNPENAVETWSGRGRMPGWVRRALALGKDLESFEVEDEEL